LSRFNDLGRFLHSLTSKETDFLISLNLPRGQGIAQRIDMMENVLSSRVRRVRAYPALLGKLFDQFFLPVFKPFVSSQFITLLKNSLFLLYSGNLDIVTNDLLFLRC
jgi:hypothetical protein